MTRKPVLWLVAIAAFFVATASEAADKVRFGTNWVAEAEHGGFYQALADGTYAKYGLDVEIVPGGPQVNNRILLSAGKLDFYISANFLQAFAAVEQNVPTVVVAAIMQRDPIAILAHPNTGIDKFDDLKKVKLLLGADAMVTSFRWLKSEHGFRDEQARPYTFNPQPFFADKNLALQGYATSEPFVIERLAASRRRFSCSPITASTATRLHSRRAASSCTTTRIWSHASSRPRSKAGTITSTETTKRRTI